MNRYPCSKGVLSQELSGSFSSPGAENSGSVLTFPKITFKVLYLLPNAKTRRDPELKMPLTVHPVSLRSYLQQLRCSFKYCVLVYTVLMDSRWTKVTSSPGRLRKLIKPSQSSITLKTLKSARTVKFSPNVSLATLLKRTRPLRGKTATHTPREKNKMDESAPHIKDFKHENCSVSPH